MWQTARKAPAHAKFIVRLEKNVEKLLKERKNEKA
jgi:hypothetical protein